MSRIAKQPVTIPSGVELKLAGNVITAKGSQGELSMQLNPEVDLTIDDGVAQAYAKSNSRFARAMAGTTRALVNNLVVGVSSGFEKRLQLVGVGYRASAQGKTLNLTLGFSHPVNYAVPDGVTVETPSQTEVIVKGADRQKVGQVAAEIRRFRPPEPYKGKGVRYADEHVRRKEAKKK